MSNSNKNIKTKLIQKNPENNPENKYPYFDKLIRSKIGECFIKERRNELQDRFNIIYIDSRVNMTDWVLIQNEYSSQPEFITMYENNKLSILKQVRIELIQYFTDYDYQFDDYMYYLDVNCFFAHGKFSHAHLYVNEIQTNNNNTIDKNIWQADEQLFSLFSLEFNPETEKFDLTTKIYFPMKVIEKLEVKNELNLFTNHEIEKEEENEIKKIKKVEDFLDKTIKDDIFSRYFRRALRFFLIQVFDFKKKVEQGEFDNKLRQIAGLEFIDPDLILNKGRIVDLSFSNINVCNIKKSNIIPAFFLKDQNIPFHYNTYMKKQMTAVINGLARKDKTFFMDDTADLSRLRMTY